MKIKKILIFIFVFTAIFVFKSSLVKASVTYNGVYYPDSSFMNVRINPPHLNWSITSTPCIIPFNSNICTYTVNPTWSNNLGSYYADSQTGLPTSDYDGSYELMLYKSPNTFLNNGKMIHDSYDKASSNVPLSGNNFTTTDTVTVTSNPNVADPIEWSLYSYWGANSEQAINYISTSITPTCITGSIWDTTSNKCISATKLTVKSCLIPPNQSSCNLVINASVLDTSILTYGQYVGYSYQVWSNYGGSDKSVDSSGGGAGDIVNYLDKVVGETSSNFWLQDEFGSNNKISPNVVGTSKCDTTSQPSYVNNKWNSIKGICEISIPTSTITATSCTVPEGKSLCMINWNATILNASNPAIDVIYSNPDSSLGMTGDVGIGVFPLDGSVGGPSFFPGTSVLIKAYDGTNPVLNSAGVQVSASATASCAAGLQFNNKTFKCEKSAVVVKSSNDYPSCNGGVLIPENPFVNCGISLCPACTKYPICNVANGGILSPQVKGTNCNITGCPACKKKPTFIEN